MLSSVFDGCNDGCGWITAVVAALAYGSYGVPIKEAVKIDATVHPFVLQSFKTGTMFFLCWWVQLCGVQVSWTPWGLLSGLLWVTGGTCGVYAIRACGMAVAVGTWASTMICVNFVWGILVFHEPVADIWSTLGAFVCLGVGLVGMSHFSAPKEKVKQENELHEVALLLHSEEDVEDDLSVKRRREESLTSSSANVSSISNSASDLQKRASGILAAVLNGLFAGSSLIPVHYAKRQGFAGANYIISFSVGALVANTVLWILLFSYYYCTRPRTGSRFQQACECLPEWHLRNLWLPGLAAGFLLSIAMFASIMTVTYLGQGVGNSIIQSKILISGLWGIFWYKEITGCATVSKWFAAASITVIGILWLSHERLAASHSDANGDHRW